MKSGLIYKHRSATDAAIQVLSITYLPISDVYALDVSWVNARNPLIHFLTESIEIKAEDMPNWTLISQLSHS